MTHYVRRTKNSEIRANIEQFWRITRIYYTSLQYTKSVHLKYQSVWANCPPKNVTRKLTCRKIRPLTESPTVSKLNLPRPWLFVVKLCASVDPNRCKLTFKTELDTFQRILIQFVKIPVHSTSFSINSHWTLRDPELASKHQTLIYSLIGHS